MAKNEGKRIIKIEENPKPANTDTGTDEAKNKDNPEESGERITFGYCLKHPIKATKYAFKKHPVAAGVVSVLTVGGLVFGGKVLVDALTGQEDSDEDEDDETDDIDVEEDDDEEDEI